MLKNWLSEYKLDLLCILLLLFLSTLFFYKLGQSSLVSWDEAWYGGIAKDILKSGDFLNLTWNGDSYTDHPPVGFWFIALSEKMLGVSDFSVRLAPAVCGLLAVLILFLLGRELFNRYVGLASAIGLTSATWFLYRSRSGNLDSILTMFFLLTLLLALKAAKNSKFLIPFAVSLGLLFLTKTLVPFTIITALMIIFLGNKFKIKEWVIPIGIFLLITGGWFLSQLVSQPGFIQYYLKIGLPGVSAETSINDNFKLIKEYLHSGVGKWFWPGVAAILLGLFLRQKRFLILAAFFFTFFIPFLFSAKGHIWHLIPLHPILIVAFFGFGSILIEKFLHQKKLIYFGLLIVSFYISFIQTKQNWYQFIDIPAFISDEAILSSEAGKYQEKFYIDGDFGPAAVFYSGKKVSQISYDQLSAMFQGSEKFVVIVGQWRLDQAKIDPSKYQIIKSDRDKLLIKKL